ncbi:condensation domain-containing protein, partial [Bacillus pumilus]|uniref:condensation domain-containing protein n=1 Tax=Bacillus pumilus TaxID=1408 RepID=UPI0034D97DF1
MLPPHHSHQYPLSPPHPHLYIFHTLQPHTTNYHIPILLTLQPTLQYHPLKSPFHHFIQTHQILRTTFHMNRQ